MLTIHLNGEPREVPGPELAPLLRELGVDPARGGVAVALNGAVVPRSGWGDARLSSGDALEIVGARQGG